MRAVVISLAAVAIPILATWLGLQFLPQSNFRDAFLPNFSATALGVVLGIPVALALNRAQVKQEEAAKVAADERRRSVRAVQYLKMLQFSLSASLQFLSRIEANLQPGTIIYSNLDNEQLESTAALKYEILDDLSLAGSLDVVRFHIRYMSRLLDLYVNMSFGGLRSAIGDSGMLRQQELIIAEIHRGMPDTRNAIDDALAKVASFISSHPIEEVGQ